MRSSVFGPALAACVAGVTAAGCLSLPAGRPVKLTAVHTPSAPASKIDLYYSAAVRAIEARDYAQALDYLQAGRALARDDVRVINAFGVVYDKLGRFDLSRRYYAEAKALEPASRIVASNQAYSARLQSLSDEPLAFASAAGPQEPLQPRSAVMPGAPVLVVPIDAGPTPVVMVATAAPPEAGRQPSTVQRRTEVAAVSGPSVKPAAVTGSPVAGSPVAGSPVTGASVKAAAAQVVRAEVAAAKPASPPAGGVGLIPARSAAKLPPRLAGAPILLIDQSGSPSAAQRLGKRLTKLGWSVQIAAPAPHGKPAEASRIDYPVRTPQIARALARTLPGAVPVRVCASGCSAIRLVVGRDARLWAQPRKALTRS